MALRYLTGRGEPHERDRALQAAWMDLERAAASGERSLSSPEWWESAVPRPVLLQYAGAVPEEERERFDDLAAEKGLAFAVAARERPASGRRAALILAKPPPAEAIGAAMLARYAKATTTFQSTAADRGE